MVVSISPALPVDLSSPTAATAIAAHIVSFASAYAGEAEIQDERTDKHCKYPSKKCWNLRALKKNGEMHKLCEFHRNKANTNQRRLEQRRKRFRTSQVMENEAVVRRDPINHVQHVLLAAPLSFETNDDFRLDEIDSDMGFDISFDQCEENDRDLILNAAIESTMVDTDVDVDLPSLAVDLVETDLYFVEQFMAEANCTTK